MKIYMSILVCYVPNSISIFPIAFKLTWLLFTNMYISDIRDPYYL